MDQYQSTLDWLFSQIPNYQKQGGSAYKPGLQRISKLLDRLGNPQSKVKAIHIAGTNGKGSVSHIFSAVLQKAGYKVGLFTSPHIFDFRERIKINGEIVSEEFVIKFIQEHKVYFESNEISFFEITTAMAFLAFAEQDCDVMVIETGLGGRLDATNVLDPVISIITNIGIDHTQFLGNTISAIATEKAGIIKRKTPVVIGETDSDSKNVFQRIAQQNQANIYLSEETALKEFKTDLLGRFQQKNIHTVRIAVAVLQELGWQISEDIFIEAIQEVGRLTNLFGRLQLIEREPDVLIDAAHNFSGMKNLLSEIEARGKENVHLIYGAADDKEIEKIVALFPKSYHYYFTEFASKRSVKVDRMNELGKENQLNSKAFQNLFEAVKMAKSLADKDHLIVICGSFYLLEKINEIFYKK
jgi:dihydrofolate synthase/folylpolyglutamate synthase